MTDDPFYAPNRLPVPRQSTPGELAVREFVRASDRAPTSCEVRFHGESYGCDVQFFERGEFLFRRGAFVMRAQAMEWAEAERKAFEKGGPS